MTGGVSPQDHGFLYGDGVYETVRCYDGQPFLWDAHYRRLAQSARLTHLRLPFSSTRLRSTVLGVLRQQKQPDASVRITLTRGPGPLGLDPALCPTPTLRLHLHPARDIARWQKDGVSAAIVSVRHIPPETLDPRIKSISLLPMVLAKAEARRRGAFEGILVNAKGELTEGTITNLFWVRKGVLTTPVPACGLLPGITRAQVLQLARRLRIVIHEGRFQSKELGRADEIFLTNASLEVLPVTHMRLQKTVRALPVGPLTRRLQEAYVHAIMTDIFPKKKRTSR